MLRFPPSFLARKRTHALTAKHLHDPVISNRAFAIFFGVASLIALALLFAPRAHAASGTWTLNGNGVWSNTANWSGGVIADGAGNTGTFSTLNITANRTVTIDGGVASRTLGIINIGDTDGTNTYTIAASGGGMLTFDNSGSNAQINQTSTSADNTISAPIVLNSSLDITNASAATLTLSMGGGITSGTAGTKTITSSTGLVTIDGVIGNGSGSVAVVQNGPGTLTLSANNTFSGGVTIKGGTVSATTNANALGSGTVTLGNTSGSANATLLGTGQTFANAITVASGSSGTLTIGNSGSTNAVFSGAVTLNNNLTLTAAGTGSVRLTGGVTGTGDITLNRTGSGNATYFSTTQVNNAGTITNTGTGTGSSTILATLGGNVTQLIQNSSTSTLILDVASNTAFVGSVAVNAGIFQVNTASALNSSNVVSIAAGATFDINGQNQTIAGLNGGSGTVTNTGAAKALTLGGSGTYSFGGTITASTTSNMSIVKSGSGTQTLSGTNTYTGATTVSGGTLLVNGSTASGSAVTVSNSGTVLGGTGTISGAVTISTAPNLSSASKLQGGDGTTGSTLTLGGALTLNDNSIIQLALGSSFTHSTLARTGSGTWTFDSNQAFTFIDLGATTGTYQNIITGILDPPSENLWTITNPGWTGMFTYDGANIDLTLTTVPEPSTWIAGGLAFAALLFAQRRRLACLIAPNPE
jgi:autotransporter-associated beta strand protein